MPKRIKDLLSEAQAEIVTISVAQAQERLKDPNTVFVDLRDIRELQREGRIANSQHTPRGMLEFWIDPDSPYHKAIFSSGKDFIFYCNKGWRSALATKTAQDMGLENICHIEGGFSAWVEAGAPIEAYEAKSKK